VTTEDLAQSVSKICDNPTAQGNAQQDQHHDPSLRLSGQQRTLVHALEQCDPALASMYRGGLLILEATDNPERLPFCAHAMRELMEKLPDYLSVTTQAQRESLKQKVGEIEESYIRAQRRSCCFGTEGWDGKIDNHLRKFLDRIQKFLDWFAHHHPRRRDELRATLRELDTSVHLLPDPLADLNIEAWIKKRDFFVAVCHHRQAPSEEEFLGWLDALERFLLDRLSPRTFDDFSEIDALLAEEESNGKS
jgi:hypothetical protein